MSKDKRDQKRYPQHERATPRNIPYQIMQGLLYCSEEQLQEVKEVLGIDGICLMLEFPTQP